MMARKHKMKALEFEGKVTPTLTLEILQDLKAKVLPGLPIRVILLLPENGETDWHRLTAEQFFKGYTEADSIYDDL